MIAANDNEEWRLSLIFGCSISSLGRLRDDETGAIKKPDLSRKPPYVSYRVKGKNYRAHVLVCTAWHGPRPSPKHNALHRDDNGRNNVPDNLRWGTQKGNGADAIANGLLTGSKLTQEQRDTIYTANNNGVPKMHLARKYGVSQHSIQQICRTRAANDNNPAPLHVAA
jgi:hypothetical protein